MAKAPIDIRSLARTHSKAAIATLASIMYEPKCKPRDRISASEALLNRGWGNATQMIAPSEQRGSGFTEIKLVIIDTARSVPQNGVIEPCSNVRTIDQADTIEHRDNAIEQPVRGYRTLLKHSRDRTR